MNIDKSNLLHQKFEGLWEYACQCQSGYFKSEGEKYSARGGHLKIIVIQTDIGYGLRIQGIRNWAIRRDDKEVCNFDGGDSTSQWTADGNIYPNGSEFWFKYSTTDEVPEHGQTIDVFVVNDLDGSEHQGSFTQTIGTRGTSGLVKIGRMKTPSDLIWAPAKKEL